MKHHVGCDASRVTNKQGKEGKYGTRLYGKDAVGGSFQE
jgi:hypothetical protein